MSSRLNSSHSLLIQLRTRRSNNRSTRWRAELRQPGFRLGERPLPTSHELAVELGVFPVEGAHYPHRIATYFRVLNSDRIMLIAVLDQGLEPDHVSGAGETDDALSAVRQILDQLEGPAANSEHIVSLVPGVIQGGAGIDGKLVDGIVDALKVLFFQAGEQYGSAEGTVEAVGLSRLGFAQGDAFRHRIPECRLSRSTIRLRPVECNRNSTFAADIAKNRKPMAACMARVAPTHVHPNARGPRLAYLPGQP